MGGLTNRTLWGGISAPPSHMAIGGYFQYSFFNRGHVLDVKVQIPKAQPSTLKIVALRRPTNIKQRHIECSSFF